jgi:hypothetical protein
MEKLRHLRWLLENLSENTGLPLTAAKDSIYTTKCFIPTGLNVVPGTGKKESVKEAFVRKIREGMEMGDTDPIFKERGPGVVRVVVALEALLKMFPGDVEVHNIVDKLLEAAKRIYWEASEPVSSNLPFVALVLIAHVELGGCIATAISQHIRCFPTCSTS